MALKPTYEMALLMQRVGKEEDLTAIPDLWALLTDKPFDAKRPLEDTLNDIVELLKPYQPEPKSAKLTVDDLTELFTAAAAFADDWIAKNTRRKV